MYGTQLFIDVKESGNHETPMSILDWNIGVTNSYNKHRTFFSKRKTLKYYSEVKHGLHPHVNNFRHTETMISIETKVTLILGSVVFLVAYFFG